MIPLPPEYKHDYNSYTPNLTVLAKSLRKNATKEENILWYQYLQHYPAGFYRQRVIDHYIVDFYCPKAKLVIEIDGSQHYTESGMLHDAIRTEVLAKYSLHVLRFSNTDIQENLRGVCEMIDLTVKRLLQK